MSKFKKLEENTFFVSVTKDAELALNNVEVDIAETELPKDLELTEYQYYIQKVGFYLVNTVAWCKQLDLAINLLSNFDYSKQGTLRSEHLIYNIENYLIRIKSVHDRVLQLVNAVFHLCINEASVNHGVIISNYKVAHRREICEAIKAISRFLRSHEQTRHTLIHRHSLLDKDLKKIEMMYANNFEHISDQEEVKKYKSTRSKLINRYVTQKKSEFRSINETLYLLINDLLISIEPEYERQKRIVG